VKRNKGPTLSLEGCARVLGCTLAQGRRTRATSCTNASASAITARRRGHERHGAAYDGDKEQLSQRASARRRRQRLLQEISSHPGMKAGITSGGAEHRAFFLGSMAGATTRGDKRVSSPLWPLAEVQALVQKGGAACRRGGRRSRRRRVVGEEEEVWDVVVPGGSGSSLGRLRSSRRMALTRAAPFLLLPSCSPLSSGGTAWLVRGVAPGAARVGSSPGARRRL
jgi:hypothetical protein